MLLHYRYLKCYFNFSFLYTCCVSDICALILDYKVPFVPSEKEYEVVFIREGERVVIPCRGSVEDLNVTLHTVRKYYCSIDAM